MNHSSNSHSRMFLTELMIAILFFSLASAVCLRMFAASRQMSRDTAEQNFALNQAGNAAELLKYTFSANEAFPDYFLSQYPYATADEAEIDIYFDAGWNHCADRDAAYHMQVAHEAEENGIIPCRIAVWSAADGEAEIYALDLRLHAPLQP